MYHRTRLSIRTAPRRLLLAVWCAAALLAWSAIPRAAADAPVPLVVYSAQGYDSAVTKAFQAASGVPVSLVDASTGPLLVKVAAEKNNPHWGVLWVDGDEPFAALDQDHQLIRGYTPNVPFNAIGRSLIPTNRSYVPTGVTMAGTVVYDSAQVTAPPRAWGDLLGPAWRNAVGMNNPAVSGPTFPFIAGMFNYLGGVDQGQKFLMALKANGLKIYQRNGNTLHALESGEIKIALIQSTAAIGAGTQAATIRTAFLRPTTPIPSVIGIDAAAPAAEIAEAKRFVEFVLSGPGQDAMKSGDATGDSLYWPVVTGVAPLPALPPLSGIPTRAIDPYKWGPMEDSINRWFVDNLVQ